MEISQTKDIKPSFENIFLGGIIVFLCKIKIFREKSAETFAFLSHPQVKTQDSFSYLRKTKGNLKVTIYSQRSYK